MKDTFVFVVGNSRSGTTMMGQILSRNDYIFYVRELHFFEQLWSPKEDKKCLSHEQALHLAGRLLSIHRDGYLTQKNPALYREEAEMVLKNLRHREKGVLSREVYKYFLKYLTKEGGGKIPCEQTPKNVFYIREIFDLYPGAKFINMIRDPRDVLLSQKNRWRRRFLGADDTPWKETVRSWVNYHPITLSKLWNASVNAAGKFIKNRRMMFVKFEDLIKTPGEKVAAVCEFIGVPFDKNMLNIPREGSSLEPDETGKRGIKRERAGRWKKGKLNSTEIYIMQKIGRRQMRTHGYVSLKVSPNPLLLGYYFLSFTVKSVLAFLLNLDRMKSIPDVLKRRLKSI